jgi:transcriptional regulator GlxA family with amidase domain
LNKPHKGQIKSDPDTLGRLLRKESKVHEKSGYIDRTTLRVIYRCRPYGHVFTSGAFPAVKLRTDLMVTDQGRLFCGGGVTADLNLALYLIDKYCGREVALQSSRCTLVDLDRLSQLPFTVFVPDKNHNDTEILDIQQWMEGNYQNAISMETLAKELGTSLRHFNRRFKSATGETGVKYLQLIRVEAAKKQLINTNLSFDEIAVDVGYENVSFFRRIFKDKTGLTPVNFRRKFMQM